jgi:hypothetical protein
LDFTLRHPGFLEKIHHTVLLQVTNIGTLSAERQDRIIAKELSLRYEHWKSLLGLLNNYEELYQPFLDATTMDITYDDLEEKNITLKINRPIEKDLEIPDTVIHPAMSYEWLYKDDYAMLIETPAAIISINERTLTRFTALMGDIYKEAEIRAKYKYIPVYKKRSFGDKSPPKEKEAGKLAWNT